MRVLVGEGERIPFGYGVAYRDFCLDTKVAYPLLVHFVVRWARDFRFWLMSVGRPGYREQIEQEVWSRSYGKGFDHGLEVGKRLGRNDFIEQTLAELDAKRKKKS